MAIEVGVMVSWEAGLKRQAVRPVRNFSLGERIVGN
jgi:hypothetical protein